MRILKTLLIIFSIAIIFFTGIYLSVPLITKSCLLNYVHSHLPASKINIEKVHYSSFNILILDNLKLFINKKNLKLNIILPKTKVKLKFIKNLNYIYQIQIIHPIIVGELNLSKSMLKELKFEKPVKSIDENKGFKNNLLQSFLSGIIKNTYIERGNILFSYIKFIKFKISNIKAEFSYNNLEFLLENLNANLFDGKLKSNIKIKFDKKNLIYKGKFSFFNVNSSSIMELMDTEGYELSGKYTGQIHITGTGNKINKITGNLTSSSKGGKISIKEDKLNKFMSKRDEKFKIAIKELKNFNYNKGIIKTKTSGNNLLIRAIFEGEQEKKDIEFVFHNLLGGRKWFVK